MACGWCKLGLESGAAKANTRPPFCQQWRQLNGKCGTTNSRRAARTPAAATKDNKCVLSGTLGSQTVPSGWNGLSNRVQQILF